MTSAETTGLLVAGGAIAAIAFAKYARKPPASHAPNEATGGGKSGAPVRAIGGVDDYVGIHVAMRVAAFDRFGIMPDVRGPDGLPVPVTTRNYAVLSVAAYWQREVNRLLGRTNSEAIFDVGRELLTLTHRPLEPAMFGASLVSLESARALHKAWDRFAVRVLATVDVPGHVALTGTLDADHAGAFWDAVGRFAIAMDVDRAVPDVGGAFVFLQYVGMSIEELPGRVAEAAVIVVDKVTGAALDVVLSAVSAFVLSPAGLAITAGAAWFYRAQLGALVGRLTP